MYTFYGDKTKKSVTTVVGTFEGQVLTLACARNKINRTKKEESDIFKKKEGRARAIERLESGLYFKKVTYPDSMDLSNLKVRGNLFRTEACTVVFITELRTSVLSEIYPHEVDPIPSEAQMI